MLIEDTTWQGCSPIDHINNKVIAIRYKKASLTSINYKTTI